MILATIDFSEAFDSVWPHALFHKLISAGLPFALLVELNLSFPTCALVRFFKITKLAPFESVEVFGKDPFLALYFSFFSSIIVLRFCLLPSAVLFMLTTGHLILLTSIPVAVEATQGALIQLERWSVYWSLHFYLSKCEASFFSTDPHQTNLHPHLLFFNYLSALTPFQLFLGHLQPCSFLF